MIAAFVVVAAFASQAPARDTTVLYLSNRAVAVFRAPLGALSPAERAEAARRRIRTALETGAESLTVRSVPEGALVLIGDRPILTVTPEDADTAGGGHLDDRVATTLAQLRLAVAEEREARSVSRLLFASAQTLAATLIMALVVAILARTRARVNTVLDGRATRFPQVSVRGFTIVTREQLVGLVRTLATVIRWSAGLVAAYLYLVYILTRFPWSRQWGEALGEYLRQTLTLAAGAVLRAVPGLFIVALILGGIRIVIRVVTAFFRAVEAGTISLPGLHPDTALPTRRILVALLWLFALALTYPYLPGSDSDAFKGVSVFAGVLITLGSSGIIGQALSGLVVMYTRALRRGEYVQVAEVEGVVTEVGLLSTKLRTNKLEEITIPSAAVLSQKVTNYSRLGGQQGVILSTTVTIGYDAPWRQVEELLLMAARDTPGVRRDPPPFVRQRLLSDFYVEYELNVHTDRPAGKPALLSALHALIQDRFNEFGVQIMSPHYEGDKFAPVVIPRDRWYARPARAAPPAVEPG